MRSNLVAMPRRRGQNAAGQLTPYERHLTLLALDRCRQSRSEYDQPTAIREAEYERMLIGRALAEREVRP